MEELRYKLDFEWHKLCNYLLLCSTADAIARAREIYYKHLIYNKLIREIDNNTLTEDQCDYYKSVAEIIDLFYLKGADRILISHDDIDDKVWELMKSAVKF